MYLNIIGVGLLIFNIFPPLYFSILNDTDQLNNEPRNRSELLLNWVEGTNRFATIRRSRIRIFVMNCTFYKWRSRQFRTGKYLIQYPVILANSE